MHRQESTFIHGGGGFRLAVPTLSRRRVLADKPIPTYLGMVLCDNVFQDAQTKKHFLLGTATHTFAPGFPARHEKMCVYTVLTGVHGDCAITLRIVRTDPGGGDDQQIMEAKGNIHGPDDPLAVIEFVLQMHNLILPAAGQYRFQLWSESTLLGERRFMVNQMPSKGPEDRPGAASL